MSPAPARWRLILAAVLAGSLGVACAASSRHDDPSGAASDDSVATSGNDHGRAASDEVITTGSEVGDTTVRDLASGAAVDDDGTAVVDDGAAVVDDEDPPGPVELAASTCAELPRTAHPDLDASLDAELLAAAACLVWFDVLDDAGYAPLEPDGAADAAEVDATLRAVRIALDAPDATARADLVAPLERRELLVEAARMLLAGGGDDRLGGVRDGYRSRALELPDALRRDARSSTWEERCPIHLDDLRLLEAVIIGFDEVERWGQLVVHHEVAADVADAFGELHGMGFPIERMEPIERYGGDDDASMAANNTSAFNCRPITGSSRWSEHSYGWAIDINPVQNPYVRGGTVLPEAGRAFLDRGDARPGMLTRPGPVDAWDAIGWGWGGDWNTLTDHQHVSLTGR